MTDENIDTKLKEDVKIAFETNLDKIHIVQDVFDVNPKLNIKFKSFESEDIYQKLVESKKAAQITLNLYKSYEIFKGLEVFQPSNLENPRENKSDNDSCLKNSSDKKDTENSNSDDQSGEPELDVEKTCIKKPNNDSCSKKSRVNNDVEEVCKRKSYDSSKKESEVTDENSRDAEHIDNQSRKSEVDNNSDLKKSHNEEPISESFRVDKPKQSEVIDKLYRYVFYFLIAKNLEILKTYEDTFGKECLSNFKCSYCNTVIECNEWECSVCMESLIKFYEEKIEKHEKSKINEMENDKKIHKKDSVVDKNVINDDDKHNRESDREIADKQDKIGGDNLDGNKWKCKHCECVNEEINVNCATCLKERTEWNCKQCTFANKISSDKCEICDKLRENKANNYDDKKNEKIMESWDCWNGKCNKRNDGNELYCRDCGLDKSASRERGATVEVKKYGEKQKVWICYACCHINSDLSRSLCGRCYESRFEVKGGNNKYDNKKKEEEIIDSWDCWNGKCKKRNDGNDLYCRDCGLDKSASRERGAIVEVKEFGKIDKLWICYACHFFNYDLSRSLCGRCYDSRFDVKSGNNEDDKLIASYEVIPSANEDNKWKCNKCQSVNGQEFLCCRQCQSSRMEIWSCKHCTAHNRLSDNHCAACGKENEDKIIKYCSECKLGEIICDDLCAACLRARNETWTCWYRFCGNKNLGNGKYCKHCGLDRYADKIDIGAPMWRCKGEVSDEIWICDKCFNINDISRSFCQKPSCLSINKYRKMCYKCKYKHNREYDSCCKMCGERLY